MRVNVRISTEDLLLHTSVVGRSGSGKSVVLNGLAHRLIYQSNGNRKHAVMIIDPHGDLGRACMSFAIQDRNRLKYLSSSINREAHTTTDYTCIFNPFICENSPELRYLLTETLTDALCELLTEATLTTQMISVIRPCIATVLRSPNPSLATLSRFFLEEQNSDLVELGKTSEVEQHRTFFTYEWGSEHLRISKNSLRVKLSFFLSDQRLASMLNGTTTVDIEKALNDGDVIILNLPKGSGVFASKVMGKLMLAYLNALLTRRDAIEDIKQRKPLFLIIDECANIVTQSLSTSLAESRKWGLSCILAFQTYGQISDAVIKRVLSVNTGLKIVGMTDHIDRQIFSKEMGLQSSDLEKLSALEFYLKRSEGRYTPLKFKAKPLSSNYFLSKKEKKKLLDWLVYESGQYIPVPPPPPLASPSESTKSTNKFKKKPPPTGGLKPAF